MKHSLNYYIKIYFKIISQDIKSKMSYRSDFLISMIGILCANACEAISFWLVFQHIPVIKGWNMYEMLFLYGFALLSATPAQCLFDNNWNLRIVVYSGDFIKYCFRPLNLYFYYISEVFDIKGLGQLGFGIACVTLSWVKLGLPFYIWSVPLLIAAVLSASLFVIAILNAASSACFWIVNSFFVLQVSNVFRDYAKYPVTIFNKALQVVFTFIMPVAFMAYYPSKLFLRTEELSPLVLLTPVFGILFFYLSYRLWMKGAMSYNGTGS